MTQVATVIVGTKFKGLHALQALDQMRAGDEVVLVRDPNNKYDAYAIECHYLGQNLGFVPKTNNTPIAKAIDGGVKAIATVTEPGRVEAGRIKAEPKILIRWGE
jgi:hypothetical protein